MDSREAIKLGIGSADMICMAYLGDMTDAELMKRPHAKCNHLNWQVGHLILAEHEMIEKVAPGTMPALPVGFAEKYAKETGAIDDPSKFCTKAELMSAYQSQRAATLAALDKTSDERLGQPSGVDYAPTVASMFTMQGSHWLMHCGQWVIVRRELNKPVVI